MHESGFPRTDQARPAPAMIDDGIRLLIGTLNRDSLVVTIGSCHGHAWGGRAPYVYFKCPVPVAAAIERTLRDAWASGAGLHAYWTVQGAFNEVGVLCFILSAPRLDNLAEDPLRSWVALGIARKRVDEDLHLLSALLPEVLAQFGNGDVPQAPPSADHEAQPDETEQERLPKFSAGRVPFTALMPVRCVISSLIPASWTRHGERHREVPE